MTEQEQLEAAGFEYRPAEGALFERYYRAKKLNTLVHRPEGWKAYGTHPGGRAFVSPAFDSSLAAYSYAEISNWGQNE